jgi:AraC family transcriptional regulator
VGATLHSVVERVVSYMYEEYSQPISLADMADVAVLSQFHFSRMFRATTGVSPGRFLSAVRLHRAKTLLLTTTHSVTDISYMVGYNSLGTFTSRFTKSVGVAPVQFRRMSGFTNPPPCPGESCVQTVTGSIDGRVSVPYDHSSTTIYLGLFDNAIAQGPLAACTVLDQSLTFALPSVPEGEWYALAVSIDTAEPRNRPGTRIARTIARYGPVKVVQGEEITLRLTMRSAQSTDPPMLLALPNLDACGPHQLVSTLG